MNKICDNASKSARIDTLERLMKALTAGAGPVYGRMNISRSGGKTPGCFRANKKGRTVLTVRPLYAVVISRYVGQQRNMARTLDGDGQLTLMESAQVPVTRRGNDLRAPEMYLRRRGMSL